MQPRKYSLCRVNDGKFCSFISPVWGIRALCRNLISHFDQRGADTITKIITIWAPPTENNTQAYIGAVAGQSGFTADQVLNLHTYADLRSIVEAIVWHENGEQPYSNAQFDEAIKLAGVVKTTPAWVKNPKVLAPTITAAATGAQQTIAQVHPIWDGLNAHGFHYHLNAQIIYGGFGVIALSGVLWFAYDMWKTHKALA